MESITYPGSSIYEEPLFSIIECRVPNFWHTNRINMQMINLQSAIKAAEKRIELEPWLIIQIIDQHGKVHWTNKKEN